MDDAKYALFPGFSAELVTTALEDPRSWAIANSSPWTTTHHVGCGTRRSTGSAASARHPSGIKKSVDDGSPRRPGVQSMEGRELFETKDAA
jgi:hypothetical protein